MVTRVAGEYRTVANTLPATILFFFKIEHRIRLKTVEIVIEAVIQIEFTVNSIPFLSGVPTDVPTV